MVTDKMVEAARAAYSTATGNNDTPHVLDGWIEGALRAALEAALSASDAEPVAWESTTVCYTKYVTDARYRKFSDAAKKWYKPYRCSSCAAPPADTHPDDLAVDRFAAAMKEKLAKKRDEGRGGWEDKGQCSNAFLSRLLRDHIEKGDPVDVGNLAMMVHQRGEMITSSPDTASAIFQLNAMVDAWEALPGGRQVRNRDVEEWLSDDMAPAINAIRGFLRRPRPDGILPPAPADTSPSPLIEPSIDTMREASLVSPVNTSQEPVNETPKSEHVIPEGWQLVPVEPTEDMTCAVDHDDCASPDAAERSYRAMLAAAPKEVSHDD